MLILEKGKWNYCIRSVPGDIFSKSKFELWICVIPKSELFSWYIPRDIFFQWLIGRDFRTFDRRSYRERLLGILLYFGVLFLPQNWLQNGAKQISNELHFPKIRSNVANFIMALWYKTEKKWWKRFSCGILWNRGQRKAFIEMSSARRLCRNFLV